ncbi:unnamed protein product [Urochloa humidicola]
MQQRPLDSFVLRIWDNAAPPKCKHFLWLVHHRRLPSAALLHHRNIIDSPLCALCGAHEDQEHLLLHCPRASAIWKAMGWNAVAYLPSIYEIWNMPQIDHLPGKIVSALISAVTWNIWKTRNAFVFNAQTVSTTATLCTAAADL